MSATHEVVKAGTFWAIKDISANRVLSTRFKNKSAANDFAELVEDPKELDRDQVTLADIARDLKIPAFRARAALRKHGMKPEAGRWKIPTGTPEYEYIRSLLKRVAKK